jgi:CyaY protein
MASVPAATPLTDSEYDRLSAAVLAAVEAAADRWLQDDVIDVDTQRTGGLLELVFPGGRKIVINTQPPLHEIWLAARQGYHFHHAGGAWIDREGREFFAVLSDCASEYAGRPLRVAP